MKLSGLTWFIVGLSVALVALAFGYFQYFQPNTQLATWYDDRSALLDAEIAKKSLAQKRVQTAEKMVEEKAALWRQTVATRTPPDNIASGGINLAVNPWQLTVDSLRFRNSIQRAVNAQVKRGHVIVEQGPEVPSPDLNAATIVANYYNYPALKFPVVIFDLGQVTVRGTYMQITDNMRSWSFMPNYLAVADGLVIDGTSPNLRGRYNVSIVGYIKGDKIYPGVPGSATTGAPGPGTPPVNQQGNTGGRGGRGVDE